MKYGGQTQYGSGGYGGDPYGFSAAYVLRRMEASLERFRRIGNEGHLDTLKRLTGSLADQPTWDLMSTAGLPAMYLVYEGGAFGQGNTSKNAWRRGVNFAVVCIAEQQTSRIERLEGRNIYHPGTETMVNWALRFVLRELNLIKMIKNHRPGEERQLVFGAERFAAVVTFTAEARLCIVDDVSSVLLERLGIVHTPLDLTQLFLPDNQTPNTDSPTSPVSGVADFDDAL